MPTVKKSRAKILGIILAILVLGGLAGFGTYYFVQYRKVTNNPGIISEQQTNSIVDAVAKHMELPTDETPTLATVQDKDKLKDQPFFTNAQNGDRILIYTKAKKAIIYREKADIIINVGPILLDQS